MAQYLWVGSQVGSTATTQQKLDQYSWNNPNNWLVLLNGSFVSPVANFPFPGYSPLDTVYFGGYKSEIYPNNTSWLGLNISTRPGWTHAKSPCLFGGYSGGVGLGAWGNTSGVGIGNTYNNGLQDFLFISGLTAITPDENTPPSQINGGYPFPWLGGGITGDILAWCMHRDGLGATAYTKANSSGIRNPQDPLTIKVHKDISIINTQLYQPSTHDSTGSPHLHTGYTKFIANINFVKALQPTGGATAAVEGVTGPTVLTRLFVDTKAGAGINFTNLYAKEAQLNSHMRTVLLPVTRNALEPRLYENIVDNGIILTNPTIHHCEILNMQNTKLVGGDVAYVLLHADGSMPGYTLQGTYKGQEDFEPPFSYSTSRAAWSAAPTYLENGWDYYRTHWEIFGVTGALADGIQGPYNGRLAATPAENLLGLDWNISYRFLDSLRITGTLVDPWNRGLELCRDTKRRIILKSSTSSPLYFRSPRFVDLNSISNDGPSVYPSFIPWSLEIADSVSIEKVSLKGSYLHSHTDIPYTASINITELVMSYVATFEPYKYNQAFDRWYIGTVNQTTGQVLGGIVFTDPSPRIWGDANFRYWNTPTIAGTNLRQSELGYASTPTLPTSE